MVHLPEDEERDENPEAVAATRARQEQRARERGRLLGDIAARITDGLKQRVGYVLNHYPSARNSDITLAVKLWQTFHGEDIEGEYVRLDTLYRLPRYTSIVRHRQKIQNEYGLFQARSEIEEYRRTRRADVRDEVIADQPGPPGISVHCDESGKDARFMVVGSVWVVDTSREWRMVLRLKEWKRSRGLTGEFKFSELSRANVEAAKEFVTVAFEMSDIMGLKACVVDTTRVQGRPIEDTVYQLHYELVMRGVEHEQETGRVALPRLVSVTKDAASADALKLSELERKLALDCRTYFQDQVKIESLSATESEKAELIQLADLFAGSIGRVLNQGRGANPKDGFARFVEGIAGFPFEAVDGGENTKTDAVYVYRVA